MDRRSVVGSLFAVVFAGATGCLGSGGRPSGEGGDPGGADGTGAPRTAEDWPAPETYDRCPRLVIRIAELPEPARAEVETAVSTGQYETTDELYLPHLLDPEHSYLEGEDAYYRADVRSDGSTHRLELTEATPSKGSHSITVENRGDDSQGVDLRVTRLGTDETVLESSLVVDAGARETAGEFERVFGEYRADVEADEESGSFTWRETEHNDPLRVVIVEDESVRYEPQAVADLIQCADVWNE